MELQSNSIVEITKALCKAQEIMKPAKKTQTNPFFKSKYAGLEDVIEAVREAFCPNDLAFFQGTLPGESGSVIIVTTISHVSGEWIRGYLPIKPTKNDPQMMGSAITYGKRYGLQALSGQPSEDDDGNSSSQKQKKQSKSITPGPEHKNLMNTKGLFPDVYDKMVENFGGVPVDEQDCKVANDWIKAEVDKIA